jgi:hypothetical protein
MTPFKVSTCTQGLYENDNGKFTEYRPRSDPWGGSGAIRGTAVIDQDTGLPLVGMTDSSNTTHRLKTSSFSSSMQ